MLLRICVGLLCLAVTAIAQNGTAPVAGDALETRFEGGQATRMRGNHFFCLGVDGNFDEFTMPMNDDTSSNQDEIFPSFLWAIFLQYPVLSYLDSQRKGSLLSAIADIVQIGADQEGGNSALRTFSKDDFCIANVTHYSVANYEESVLIHMYFQGNTVFNSDNIDGTVSIQQFVDTFKAGFGAADDSLVQSFEGRRAIVVNVPVLDPDSDVTETELNQHPGFLSADEVDDPTRRAVFVGAYSRGTTIEEALNNPNRTSFASNPDPTNFGLEAGDIVFAVFGALFLTAVGVMTLIGFFIHPFFLA